MKLEKSDRIDEDIIYLQFKYIPAAKELSSEEPKSDRKLIIAKNRSFIINESPKTETFLDSIMNVNNTDSINVLIKIEDSEIELDSFIIKNPSMAALKAFVSKNLKNLNPSNPDSVRISNSVKQQLLTYYNFLYPTPLSKFKDMPKGGGMISIPIDDIINLFK